MRNAQRGNILFLILLAVILFAALSYAVTSSMRGGGKSGSDESLKSQIAQIQNYGMQIRSALLRMTTTGGLQPWQIDYSKTGMSIATANATCTDTSCKLFDPAGGGVGAFILPAAMLGVSADCGYVASSYGRPAFTNIGVKGLGVDSRRDLMLLFQGVNKDLCVAINDQNGVSNVSGEPQMDDTGNAGCNQANYTGTLSQDVTIDSCVDLGDSATTINGKQMFCTKQSGGGNGCYFLWYALIER